MRRLYQVPGSEVDQNFLTPTATKLKMKTDRIEIVEGDITKQRVGAIVNAPKTTLPGGGGVNDVIDRAVPRKNVRPFPIMNWRWLRVLPDLILTVTLCSSCSSPGISRVLNEPMPLPQSVRTTFGRVGLLPPESDPRTSFHYPDNTSTAMVRAAEKTWKHIDLDDGAGEIVAGLFVSSVAGVVGGYLTGLPQREIDAGEMELRRALREVPLLPGIHDQVMMLLQKQGNPSLIAVPEQMFATLRARGETNRDYRSLSRLGIDSVMEIAVYRQAFRANDRINPPMSFDASIHVYVTRVSDGTTLFVSPLDYRSHSYRFKEWAAQNAKKFRAELKRIQRVIAEAIIEQSFVPPRTEL